MRRRVTVVEVAARAGVSIATVSRVLNGKSARPASTTQVLAAAAELGYVPDATGRALRLGQSLQIAFAVDDVANPVYTEMMRGVERGLAGSGCRLLVASTGHAPDDLLSLVGGLSRGYADGLIISPLARTPELAAALVAAPVPVVIVGDVKGAESLDRVTTDSAAAIRMAYRHLVDTGHARIGFVGGPEDTAPGAIRLAAFRDASERLGSAGPVVGGAAFTVAAGEAAWDRWAALPARARPDAVLAANDLLAIGVMRAAISARVAVPGRLAVAGIDDTEFARVYSPSLTSVSLKAEERGEIAARMLLERLSAVPGPARVVRVAPELVIRQSTSPAAARRTPPPSRATSRPARRAAPPVDAA